jgi:hypothetical protein
MKRAIYITVFSLACMTPAAGAAIIVMCIHDDAWRRQGSNFGDGGRSAVSLTFSSSHHHAAVIIITCHLALPSPLSTTELNEAQLTQ